MTPQPSNILATALLLFIVAGSAPARQDSRHVQRLTVPGRAWALELNLPNFNVRQNLLSADGRARKLRADIESEGCVLTVNIVPASTPKVSSQDLRDLAAERLKAGAAANADGFKTSEYGRTPTIEYLVRDFKSQPVGQKHFYAYISRDNIWIDIHLSKAPFREGDEKLFRAILDSLRFTDSAGE